MADMTTIEDAQKMMGALGYPMALPQRLEKVTNTTDTRQRVNYDPQKWQALMDALGRSTPRKSGWESAANVLAQMPQGRSFTGAYGTEVINPWTDGLATFARSFGGAYGDRLASEREAQAKDLENQIKTAQLDAEASKENVQNTTENTWMKLNDSNAKEYQEAKEKMEALQTVEMMMNQLEDIGTRIDEDYKSIDDMQQNQTKAGRSLKGAFFGAGRTSGEKQADNEYKAWQGSMKNVLVNANKKAGSGSMSDEDAKRYEQGIAQAESLQEAREIMRSFLSRLSGAPIQGNQKIQEMSDVDKWIQGVK